MELTLAVIAKDIRDEGLIVAHAQNEGFEYPVVHAKLEFLDGGDQFIPVLTFCPIIDAEKDEESQRRVADSLKKLIMDHIKFPLRFKFDPNGELLGMVVKDGKIALVPLPKQLIKPKDDNGPTPGGILSLGS